jgi:hypothetical protein
MTEREHYHHPAAFPDEKLLDECVMGQSRASGPGGQHRNKVSTQVTLTHQPTGLAATAGERRSQRDNKAMALRRLRLKLAVEHRRGVASGDIGSELLRSRKETPKKQPAAGKDPDEEFFKSVGIKLRTPNPAGTKKRLAVNERHRDFPAILAEVLDAVAAAGWEAKHAATRLGVSQSQILKLIKKHPPALHELNERRKERGKHVYH